MICSKRLCWNCEADIDAELSRCPYCGADPEEQDVHSAKENFDPPYRLENIAEREAQQSTPYQQVQAEEVDEIDEEEWDSVVNTSHKSDSVSHEVRQGLLKELQPLLFLMPGAVFFVFGLLLLMYSGQDTLVLEWKTSLWPIYLAPSLVLLYFGWLRLSSEDDSSSNWEE